MATGSSGRRRRYDFRPAKTEVPVKKPKAEWLKVMAAKLDSEEGRALYRLRQQTVEPVFGIIKAALGFTGFSLRGLDKVAGEWDLVALSYNCKRLHKLKLVEGLVRALLARQIDAKARPRPSSAENRPAIDPSEPILAVSPNFDRATDRRQPNHSTPNSDPQVRQTAKVNQSPN